MTRHTLKPALLIFALLGSSASIPSFADRLAIPLGQQGDHWNVKRPKSGRSKSDVLANFGEPTSKYGPVGEPPIYTWNYPQFNVIFENDHVIHSVVKHQAKNEQ